MRIRGERATIRKEMGADVAASPHCPIAAEYQAWEARQSAGRFRGRVQAGGSGHDLRGPSGACAPFGFPAGSPSGPKPWRFAARQIRNRGSGSRRRRSRSRSSGPPSAGFPRPKPWDLPGGPWTCALGPPVSQLPGRNPVLPDASGPKPFPAGGSAPTEASLSAGQVPDRSPTLSLGRDARRLWTVGRFTKPAAFASAKGQARSFRLAAASSAARPSLRASSPGGARGRFAPAVAGKAFDRCRSIVSATGRKLS